MLLFVTRPRHEHTRSGYRLCRARSPGCTLYRMHISRLSPPWALLVAAIAVFLFFFGIFSALKLSHPGVFSTPDDPYFHARYAALLSDGVASPPLPYVSTISWFGGGSVYTGYHKLLASLISITDTSHDNARLIEVSKLFHAALSALVLTIFFVGAYRILTRFKRSVRVAVTSAMLLTILLLILFPSFALRLCYERPGLIACGAFIMLVEAVLVHARLRCFFITLTVAYCYSFSAFLLLPIFMLFVCDALTRDRAQFIQTLRILVVALFGLAVGVMLQPNPLFYLYNAQFVSLAALWNALAGNAIAAKEISVLTITSTDWFFILSAALVLLILYHVGRGERQLAKSAHNRTLMYLAVLSSVLLVITMLFKRGMEYYAPVVLLTLLYAFLVWFDTSGNLIFARLRAMLHGSQRTVIALTLALFVGIGAYGSFERMYTLPSLWHTQLFADVFSTLKDVSSPGDKVYVAQFHVFAPAYFYVPELQYSQGMESTFTMLADRELYWLSVHTLVAPDTICPRPTCALAEYTPFDVVHDRYGARFVIREVPNQKTGPDVATATRRPFEDPRFIAVRHECAMGRCIEVYSVADEI